MNLVTHTWSGRAMGTVARLIIVTDDARAGDDALRRAAEDLEATEQSLSRFRMDSELGILNREGTLAAGWRLLTAFREAASAHDWSSGLLDPRVIASLEGYGYREALPQEDLDLPSAPAPLEPANLWDWIDETGRITLPAGVRLDLAGVGKALGIGWAARHLVDHAGLLVDVGGDIVALGHDEQGEPWRIAVDHNRVIGEFSGHSLAVATSTTTLRTWTAAGRRAHHLIDPRTGAPSESGLLFATVAASSILEADLAAKLLIIEGQDALERLGEDCRAIVTDRRERTTFLEPVEVGR